MNGTLSRRIVPLLFFLSGAGGLVYQVVWTKELVRVMGVSVYAVSTVLAAFMAGLALGSHLLGKGADRAARPLRLYALLEGGIGLYALGIPFLLAGITRLYVLLHAPSGASSLPLLLLRFGLCFAVLLFPTTLMGGTLPVLSKFYVQREGAVGRGVGLLYALNTAGAVAGALAAGFCLIPALGIFRTTLAAVAVNLLIAIVSWILSLAAADGKEALPPGAPAATPGGRGARFSPAVTRLVFAAAGVSGFAALGYEVLWTRTLVYFLGPSTYAFTTMLATFLLGIAAGSLLIARLEGLLRAPVGVLGLLQGGVGVGALAALLLVGRMFQVWDALNHAIPGTSWWIHMGIRFSLAFLFMFLPTLFMGAAFPLAARIYARGLSTLGRRVGDIYSINTLCAIAGSLVTGFLLVPRLGLQRSMVVLAGLNVLAGTLLSAAEPRRSGAGRGAALCAGLLCLAGTLLFFRDRPVILASGLVERWKDQPYRVLYCKEGVDASLAVIEGTHTRTRQLNINGTSTAYTDVTDLQVHRMLAHLPMVLHPDPRTALVIGFGFGSTAYGILQYGPERVDCVELVDDERLTATFFEDQNHGVLEDPRFRFIAEDGRNFVLTTRNTYDVISVNAIHPSLAPTLYTRDFFALCRARLRPAGLVCLWLPTTMLETDEFFMLLRTFQDVYPKSTLWYVNPGNVILLGGLEPFRVDFARLERRLALPGVRADLGPVHLSDPVTLLALLVLDPEGLARCTGPGPLNTDDRPFIEFSRSMYAGFREDLLDRLFFTEKADPARFLRALPAAGKARDGILRRIERRCRAWPFMVEGHLLSIGTPSDAEREGARWCFRQALLRAPRDPDLRFLYGYFSENPKLLAWRIGRLEKRIAETPGNRAKALERRLASLYLEAGRFEEARAVLERIGDEGGTNPSFFLDRAYARTGCGREAEAIADLRAAVARFPEAPEAHARLALRLLLSGGEDAAAESLAHARTAVRLAATPGRRDLLGLALLAAGDRPGAVNAFEAALKRSGPVYLVYRYHLRRAGGRVKND